MQTFLWRLGMHLANNDESSESAQEFHKEWSWKCYHSEYSGY